MLTHKEGFAIEMPITPFKSLSTNMDRSVKKVVIRGSLRRPQNVTKGVDDLRDEKILVKKKMRSLVGRLLR